MSTTFGNWVQVEGLRLLNVWELELAFGELWFVVSGFAMWVSGSRFGFEVLGV